MESICRSTAEEPSAFDVAALIVVTASSRRTEQPSQYATAGSRHYDRLI